MPSPPLAFRAVAVLAIFAFLAGCLAAVANAQAPAPTTQQRTLVAVGTGTIKVTPKDRNDNASIVAAVKDANDKALPAALTDARTQATQLAAAAGVTLGPVISLSNSGTSAAGVFYGPYYGVDGSFGPEQVLRDGQDALVDGSAGTASATTAGPRATGSAACPP